MIATRTLWLVAIPAFFLCVLVGMAIGGLSGSLLQLVLKVKAGDVFFDAVLGAVGFFAGALVTATANIDQYSIWAALALAVLLPAIREVYRVKQIAKLT